MLCGAAPEPLRRVLRAISGALHKWSGRSGDGDGVFLRTYISVRVCAGDGLSTWTHQLFILARTVPQPTQPHPPHPTSLNLTQPQLASPPHQPPMSNIFSFRSRLLVNSSLFTLRASPKTIVVSSDAALRNPQHPLHQRTVARSLQRQKELNQYYVVPLTVHKKSCVRSRIRRRIHEATRLAFAELGYRLDGMPLNDKDGDESKRVLGTLAYFPQYKAVSADWKALQDEVRRGVVGFMEMQREDREATERRRMREWQGGRGENVRREAEKPFNPGVRPSMKPKHYGGGGTRERRYPTYPQDDGGRGPEPKGRNFGRPGDHQGGPDYGGGREYGRGREYGGERDHRGRRDHREGRNHRGGRNYAEGRGYGGGRDSGGGRDYREGRESGAGRDRQQGMRGWKDDSKGRDKGSTSTRDITYARRESADRRSDSRGGRRGGTR